MRTYRTILGMLVALRRLRRRDDWTRPQIEAHQARSLQQLRRHTYAHSSFYQKFHKGLTNRPLNELPVLTKEMLHDHFDEIVTDRAIRRAAVAEHTHTLKGAEWFLDRYIVNATSGTTGNPSYILFDHTAWATVLASYSRYEKHVGSLWGLIQRPKMAVVASSTPWHMSARVGTTVRSSVLPMLRLDVGDPLDSLVQRLNAWQPYMLATYASMAGILADEQQAGRLQISPTRVVSTAEVLTPPLRQRIESTWGKIVFDQYGASEGGSFAVECEAHHGRHIFEDLFILEVVDRHNQPVPPGTYGDKVLLTVLFNYAQPLIRYEMTDSLCISPAPCPCGRAYTLIEDIQGRKEEVLRFSNYTNGTSPVHPMLFYRILDAEPVHGWQVVQEPERLCLYLNGDARAVNQDKIIQHMREALAKQGVVAPAITVEWRPDVLRGSTGKASRIVSKLAHGDNGA